MRKYDFNISEEINSVKAVPKLQQQLETQRRKPTEESIQERHKRHFFAIVLYFGEFEYNTPDKDIAISIVGFKKLNKVNNIPL